MALSKIESPCIKLCAVNGRHGMCMGCGRTLQEIGGWMQYTDQERSEIMATLPERLAKLADTGAA
ncbi:MAG: DUF1289 domain-containing protein [Henriciella sp.]|nr:DUF1289 domain-containing protein [Henriciella sp.]